MQHNTTISIEFSIDEIIDMCDTGVFERMKAFSEKVTFNEIKKSNLTEKAYYSKIRNDWNIIGGENIIKENLADSIINMYGLPDNF